MAATRKEPITLLESPFGSPLYRQCLVLREAILRKPLGLTLSPEELADDASRRHFCAVAGGQVVGCLSLKTLDGGTLQLKQMAVAEASRKTRIGSGLVAFAEAWARENGASEIVLHPADPAAKVTAYGHVPLPEFPTRAVPPAPCIRVYSTPRGIWFGNAMRWMMDFRADNVFHGRWATSGVVARPPITFHAVES